MKLDLEFRAPIEPSLTDSSKLGDPIPSLESGLLAMFATRQSQVH